MILRRSMRPPRASIEYRTMTDDELKQRFQALFLAGEEVPDGQGTAERLSAIAAAHRIMTNSFAMIPFGVFRRVNGARVPVDDRALERLLREEPNSRMTPYLAQKLVMSNAFWHGFGAMWNRRDDMGRVIARIPLPTDCCSISYDPDGMIYWYTYSVEGLMRTFAPSELSFLFFETYDGVFGRGILDLARDAVRADAQAQRYNGKFYQNGARLSGIVEVDTDANGDARDKIRSEFRRYAGDDAFAVAVLDHNMKYTPLGVSQSDAQYIEARSFAVEEVARFTGIPKSMLQTGKESYDSNQQQRLNWVTDSLLPFVVQWETEDRRKLLTRAQREQKWYLKGNVSVLLRGDDMTRSQFYERMVRNSIYNPDECRALEEKAPIPGGFGQKFFMSKNMGSLESIAQGGEANG